MGWGKEVGPALEHARALPLVFLAAHASQARPRQERILLVPLVLFAFRLPPLACRPQCCELFGCHRIVQLVGGEAKRVSVDSAPPPTMLKPASRVWLQQHCAEA